ncbi:MAG TPA: peptide chain release factor-like protein [Candidatus Limnocylindria bacterium]|jgi:protein subunit release factor B|nr:peptide chain release factor-like protein [Candidatus Limnocylindria bacterium]
MARTLMFSVGESDLIWEFFRCGGKGGQKQNKTSSGARVRHEASGAVAESREQRQQIQNRRTALKRLAEDSRFKAWVMMEAAARLDVNVDPALRIESGISARTCVPGEAYCDLGGRR